MRSLNLQRVLQISPLRWPMGAQKYLLIGGQGGAATPALAKHLVIMCVCVCDRMCVMRRGRGAGVGS